MRSLFACAWLVTAVWEVHCTAAALTWIMLLETNLLWLVPQGHPCAVLDIRMGVRPCAVLGATVL